MTDRLPELRQALRGVLDPETGRDLIAMGMIYDLRHEAGTVHVTMTTTTRGCPLTEMLRMGVQAALLSVPGIAAVEVTLTWEPPWSPDRMEPPAP
ncbi:metal-sulfur cluster assembly factor [Paracoccus aminovorans]|uniref:metal-sulfur cluster assembly factor n=1 Tax=Paracoccus aminovorans TaxID=34004 RepID=UPI000784BDAF|nr:metal-sulfur cluster assembly factor [Paracoccus aminovorans]MDQ7776185.1 metal-sulfur cluster assembly factor [Paracoccus aminovorans]